MYRGVIKSEWAGPIGPVPSETQGNEPFQMDDYIISFGYVCLSMYRGQFFLPTGLQSLIPLTEIKHMEVIKGSRVAQLLLLFPHSKMVSGL